MSALPLPIGAFGISIDIAKIRLLYDNTLCFCEKIKRNKKLHVSHKTSGKQFHMLFVSCQPSCDCDILSSSQAQAIHPAELTFFGIEGRFLVDSNGEPVFEQKD